MSKTLCGSERIFVYFEYFVVSTPHPLSGPVAKMVCRKWAGDLTFLLLHMPEVRIEPFKVEMTAEASGVLARAFVTNPQNMAAFGPNQLARNETFFRNVLSLLKGTKLVAIQESRIVGLIHWVQSPACQMSGLEKLKTVPMMIGSLGLGCALRVGNWLSVWERHDPPSAHFHLGPIGVDPAVQRRQIGRHLMEAYCQALDQAGLAGYLETDRPGNVGFYRRFGFETVKELPVLGVPNFLMQRTARPRSNLRDCDIGQA